MKSSETSTLIGSIIGIPFSSPIEPALNLVPFLATNLTLFPAIEEVAASNKK